MGTPFQCRSVIFGEEECGADWFIPVGSDTVGKIALFFCPNTCKNVLLDCLLGNPPDTAIAKVFELAAV